MSIHRAEVIGTQRLSPGLVRITLAGPGLSDFVSTGVGDEYLRVFFPHGSDRSEVSLPYATEKAWDWPDGAVRAPMRTYTVRDHRPAHGTVGPEVDIDFVVHDGGVAAAWALAAAPGDVVGLNSPTGLYEPPDDLTWQLLVADQTGLPAAARLLADAPVGVRTRAVLEVPDPEHRIEVADGPDTEVRWVYGGNGHGPSRLDEVVAASLGATSTDAEPATGADRPSDLTGGYVWVAGETRCLRAVRKHLRHTLGLPSTRYKVIGYWTEDAEEWRDRFAALDQSTRDELMAMWDSDRDPDEIEDAYVQRLEALGL